jgi:hypothetical protein
MKPPVFESRAGRLCGGMLDASEATEWVFMPAMSDFVPIFDFTEANFADTRNTIKLFESSNHCSMPTEPSVRHETKNPEDLIRGQNRMAELVRAHDWSATPLGPIEVWSEALLLSANLMPPAVTRRSDGQKLYFRRCLPSCFSCGGSSIREARSKRP